MITIGGAELVNVSVTADRFSEGNWDISWTVLVSFNERKYELLLYSKQIFKTFKSFTGVKKSFAIPSFDNGTESTIISSETTVLSLKEKKGKIRLVKSNYKNKN